MQCTLASPPVSAHINLPLQLPLQLNLELRKTLQYVAGMNKTTALELYESVLTSKINVEHAL